MAWFSHGHDTKARAELAELRADLAQLRRELADLDATVLRWQKRDRERARREDAVGAPGNGAPAAGPGMAAPPNLRGARLRIWQRRHGITQPELLELNPDPEANGSAE